MLAMLDQAYGFAMRGGIVAFAAPSLWVYIEGINILDNKVWLSDL